MIGTVGRERGHIRLRVAHHTDKRTLKKHIETFMRPGAEVNTDEWRYYADLPRAHATVDHRCNEWARDDDDDDGDGIREVHINTQEGLWTGVRDFLRPFRGVHKRYLSQYSAICEFNINHKKVTPKFISSIVALH